MNICEHLVKTARIFPQRTAIRFEQSSYSYSQLEQWTAAAAEKLSQAGIARGDRVALMLPNSPAFVVWYYAAARLGAVAVSISTRSTATEVEYLLEDSGATAFVHLARVDSPPELPTTVTVITTTIHGDGAGGAMFGSTGMADYVDCEPGDAAAILYTSGTTGFPKGATLSHNNVRTNVCAFNHLCHMRPDDRILLSVPLFHCFGQNALMNAALNVGATLVLQRAFDLHEAKRLIQDEKVSQLYGVPMMFQLLLDSCQPQDLASVNYCFSAAATLPVQVSQRWQQQFNMPIYEGYGLTESSPFASYNHRNHYVEGSIGTPIDGVEMKIADPATGEVCGPGELGEIIIRGPNVMLGYWNRAEDTATAIRNGWLRSGDIGRMDERGFFYIVDRVKDMIAIGGLKVFPAEVERVLLDHDAVAEAAVVGVADAVLGEKVVAFVVLKDGREAGAALEALKQHTRQHLANYKAPRNFVPLEKLPRNASGKILKRELKAFDIPAATSAAPLPASDKDMSHAVAEDAASPVPAPPAGNEGELLTTLRSTHASARSRAAITFIQQRVQAIAATDELPGAKERFLDLGMDSLMIVELSEQIQQELGPQHNTPATLIFDYPRIVDLSEYVLAQLEEKTPQASSQPATPREQSPASTSARTQSSQQIEHDVQSMSEQQALEALLKELNE